MPENDSDDKTRSQVQLAHGSIIGHYRIVEKIGAGGMGEVYLADDTQLDREMAVIMRRFSSRSQEIRVARKLGVV